MSGRGELFVVHVKRYLMALAALLVLYSTYALAVAPWLAPPAVVRATPTRSAGPAIAPPTLPDAWRAHFAPDAWELQTPKVVETERCTLLIQDYQTTADGRLELKPCTLIFHSASSLADENAAPSTSTGAGAGRPIILQAPKAELAFDKPLDLTRATFGRVEKGTLSGEIRIFSPPSSATANDALEVRTRAVWLDRETIRTANDVEFRYGESSGRGRDLEISLLQRSAETPPAAKAQLMGVHTLTLRQLHYLRLVVPGSSLLGPVVASRDEPSAPPLDITCQGEFVFDAQAQIARFQERVRVARVPAPGVPPDALECEELLLTLGSRTPTSGEGAAAEATSSSDPLAGRLQRIIALGQPATLAVPSRGIKAQAAYMEYSLVENSIQLKSDAAQKVKAVSLTQFDQHCVAPELHYKLPTEGRLGRLHAGGPGELRLLQGRGPERHFITARWERSLEMQPQDRNHVISLQGSAGVTMDPLGQFTANELHLWVLEAPPPAAVTPPPTAGTVPTTGTVPTAGTVPAKEGAAILPDRLLAVGNVRLNSSQLDVDTSRLEAWFLNLPPAPGKAPQPRRIDGPIREPVARVSYEPAQGPQGAIQNRLREPSVQRFRVAGGVIRTQFVLRGSQFDLEDLHIRGQAEIDETRTPEPGLEPLRLRGEVLELRHGTRPDAYLQVTGLPAEVAGRGMSLAGGRIEVYRAANELRIDGPGEATTPAGGMGGGAGALPGLNSPPADGAAAAAGKLHILWNSGLVFDGSTARFTGEVVLRSATDTASQTARTPTLLATLNRRLDFSQALTGGPQSLAEPPLGLARVVLDGEVNGVYVENQSFNEFGEQLSRDQAHLRNIAIDQTTGAVLAQGPGWVSTVRRSASVRGAAAGGAAPEPVAGANAKPDELTSIHVAFEREMAGDLNQKWIEFRQQVLTTYSPAADFGEIIAADPLGVLGERMLLMRSETLRLTDMTMRGQAAFEMEARGRTKVEAANLVVDAPIVRYASDKDALTIEGDGRATAQVFSTLPGREGTFEGRRFWYNLKSGDLQMDGAKIQFNLPANLPIRGPGQGFNRGGFN